MFITSQDVKSVGGHMTRVGGSCRFMTWAQEGTRGAAVVCVFLFFGFFLLMS